MAGVGRVEPTRRSDSAPETCHPPAIPDWNFERVGKDRLWPDSGIGTWQQSGQRPEADCLTGSDRPLAAGEDFPIE